MKKFFCLILIVFQLFVLSGCQEKVNILGDGELFVGDEIELSINGQLKNYTWSSNDDNIATIKDGKITAHSAGIVEIYLLKKGKVIAQHNLEVKSYIPKSIEVINILYVYHIGQTYNLQAKAHPEYSKQEFVWEGSSKVELNKDTGEVTFLEEGDVYILCRSKVDQSVVRSVRLVSRYHEDLDVVNLLFIGNSLTYRNDVPEMVRKIGISTGKAINSDSITVGGSTLREILTKQDFNIKTALNNKKYDYIIIQEASAANFQDYESFLSAARDFKALADDNGAQLILYQTWAYSGISNPGEMQGFINNAYYRVSQELKVRVNPVGEVFYDFVVENPDIDLYMDMNHASLAGSYLASCVHYACLFNESVIDNPYEVDLDKEIVRRIQEFVSLYLHNYQ